MTVVEHRQQSGEIVVVGARREGKARALGGPQRSRWNIEAGTLLDDPGYDSTAGYIAIPCRAPFSGAVYGQRCAQGCVVRHEWDEGNCRLTGKTAGFPGQVVRIVGNNADRSGILIQAFSEHPPQRLLLGGSESQGLSARSRTPGPGSIRADATGGHDKVQNAGWPQSSMLMSPCRAGTSKKNPAAAGGAASLMVSSRSDNLGVSTLRCSSLSAGLCCPAAQLPRISRLHRAVFDRRRMGFPENV